ncbi:hypothetical protein [Frankia sp. AiPa1]|uniref:hypothetical protein n=1 Tax=Frankia sp. AiPa1 TaxID=573492 RepID=UPI00202B27DC|nr:hypothetical protein [Frankia sp. AiPa1]MCL9762394.1 hypothetical protein [Frankia sp. AiPa1]
MTAVTGGELVSYAVIVLNADDQPVEALGGWDTARQAEEYARTLTGIAGYRIVPLGHIAGP